MPTDPVALPGFDDAQATLLLQPLYRRAGGRRAATPDVMLRTIADDASNLQRLDAFPQGFEAAAIAVVQRHGARIDAELRIDLLALACEAGYDGLAATLLAARIAWRDGDRFQCMALAIRSGRPALVGLLLDAGIDVRTRSACGATLLVQAIDAGDTGIVQLLRNAGAVADPDGQALAAAAVSGDPDLLGMCISDGATSAALANALDHAAHAGQYAALVMLLQAGAAAEPALGHAMKRGDAEAADLINGALAARLLAAGNIVSQPV